VPDPKDAPVFRYTSLVPRESTFGETPTVDPSQYKLSQRETESKQVQAHETRGIPFGGHSFANQRTKLKTLKTHGVQDKQRCKTIALDLFGKPHVFVMEPVQVGTKIIKIIAACDQIGISCEFEKVHETRD
jgi:hypothetical protein